MIRKEQKVFELEYEHIWARPNEDLVVTLDFEKNMTGAIFELFYEEHNWPYMPTGYTPVDPGSITAGFVQTDSDDFTDAIMTLTIPLATISSWKDKRLDVQLQVQLGGSTWIAYDGTITIAQGD